MTVMPIALIMAGGRSLRMRASLSKRHKALVEVLGVSMLERNILALLSHGFQDIVVAVSAREQAVIAFARGRAARAAHAAGASLRVFVEKQPLGTIGAARAIPANADNLLVVNVDNLTSLDLTALLARHQTTKAAMTIAIHTEPFRVPFGQVSIRRGKVIDYKEKPVLPVLLSSGTYVLTSAARRRIPPGRPVGAPELVHILLGQNERVSAFLHSSAWIDVNDSASVERAEALIMANSGSFELWRQPWHCEMVVLGVFKNRKDILVRSDSRRPFQNGMLPVEQVLSEVETPVDSASRIGERIGLPVTRPQLVASFDELSLTTSQRTRYHLFVCGLVSRPRSRNPASQGGVCWVNVEQLSKSHGKSRTVAYLKRYAVSQDPHSVCH
jgi:NDP-mannose synthase